MNRRSRKHAAMIYVAIYNTNRAYGGPEEGGWWYDVGHPEPGMTETFFNEDNAYARAREINEFYCDPDNESRGYRGDIGSVACEYALAAIVTHGEPPAPYPTRRPHYE